VAKRIRVTGAKTTVVRNAGPALPRLDPSEIAARLGAEPVPEARPGRSDVLSLAALGSELARRLRSSGGRPALTGTARRLKVPLSPEDVRTLGRVAQALASLGGFGPSLGQVASVILHMNLEALLRATKDLKELDSAAIRDVAASLAAAGRAEAE
jgi:hypothetical protein